MTRLLCLIFNGHLARGSRDTRRCSCGQPPTCPQTAAVTVTSIALDYEAANGSRADTVRGRL